MIRSPKGNRGAFGFENACVDSVGKMHCATPMLAESAFCTPALGLIPMAMPGIRTQRNMKEPSVG